MSSLNITEQHYLERVLDMGSGFVLSFTDPHLERSSGDMALTFTATSTELTAHPKPRRCERFGKGKWMHL